MGSSRREQNWAPLVGSGEHPDLRCPRTSFADRRRLPSATTPAADRDGEHGSVCILNTFCRRLRQEIPNTAQRLSGSPYRSLHDGYVEFIPHSDSLQDDSDPCS
jgi:hypothetical protein